LPIYEYRCQSCEYEMEKLQKISDDPLMECPSCHESALKKLVSAAGFRLSGSGWYETDFKKGKMKNVTNSGSADSAGQSDSAAKKPTNSASATSGTASSGTSGSQ